MLVAAAEAPVLRQEEAASKPVAAVGGTGCSAVAAATAQEQEGQLLWLAVCSFQSRQKRRLTIQVLRVFAEQISVHCLLQVSKSLVSAKASSHHCYFLASQRVQEKEQALMAEDQTSQEF